MCQSGHCVFVVGWLFSLHRGSSRVGVACPAIHAGGGAGISACGQLVIDQTDAETVSSQRPQREWPAHPGCLADLVADVCFRDSTSAPAGARTWSCQAFGVQGTRSCSPTLCWRADAVQCTYVRGGHLAGGLARSMPTLWCFDPKVVSAMVGTEFGCGPRGSTECGAAVCVSIDVAEQG